jgi:hypothetical protein
MLWARIEFIRWRDGVGVKPAADTMRAEGYIQRTPDGKYWATRVATDSDQNKALVDSIRANNIMGDIRGWDPAEQFRLRYYKVQKKIKTDAALKDSCEFFLRLAKETHITGDPMKALDNVMDDGDKE